MIDIAIVDRIVAQTGRTRDAAIRILTDVQKEFNYLPEDALKRICETTDITAGELAGVATFYSQFRHKPAGRHSIKVCIGTACHVKGAETVLNSFKQYLEIPEGEDTDADRMFTVEKVACLGCCMLAPAVQIGDITYGHVDIQKIPLVLKDFLNSLKRVDGDTKDQDETARATVGEVRMCGCSSCTAGGARKVMEAFRREIQISGLGVRLKEVACTGMSFEAPLVEVVTGDGTQFRYGRIGEEDAKSILLRHFSPSGVVRRAGAAILSGLEQLLTDKAWEPVTRYSVDVRDGAYCDCQKHIATEHAGDAVPLDIDDYIARGGFDALKTCVEQMDPAAIIEKVSLSGLRGRGGAGFDTARKWQMVRSAAGDKRYVICNGDEGDPGAFMDRMILESFPFRVIEGIGIAAYAVGADEAVIYVRAEYPLAVRRMNDALELCRERNIMPFLQVSVVEGAGAFVCGEETALIAAIEGRRGMPEYRPPYPSTSGLNGCPTLVNNVETLALVPWIVGSDRGEFAAIGTEKSKGTKAFALAGKVERGGLIEIPMGMTLRQIVEDVGGGIQDGRTLKAVQVGGPSGGCVPASMVDTPVDYEALVESGAIMGSGGLVVLDDTDCMVDIARYFLSFTQMESCGKCTFCRVGTKCMLEILEGLCEGRGTTEDIDKLERLAFSVKDGSLCGLGRTAPNPVLSTLKHFRSEYDAHIEGRCPAKKCAALIVYVVNDNCIGCTRCAQRCPVDAIEMKPYEKHEIDSEKCVRCDTCRAVCPSDAINIESK